MAENGIGDGRPDGLDLPDEVEIRRLSASSKEEAEDIRAELERRGFAVIVREAGAAEIAPGMYHADIFAEKRTVLTETERDSRRIAHERELRVRRRDYRLILIGLAVILGLGLIALAVLLGPLISLVRSLLD